MKKKLYLLGVAALVAAMLGMSGVAQSAMWVGAELGGNFNSADLSLSGGSFNGSRNFNIKPSVIGGATIGYDFVNAGFGAYAWPDWMKYFSFAMDLTYNRLNVSPSSSSIFSPGSRVNGYEVAWTFLFMAHYGFLPDSEVPTGRINPYLGVGPAILWTGTQFTTPGVFHQFGQYSSDGGDNSMNVALVVEPGIRWMAMKNVSIDTAMRYRYAAPSWSDNSATLRLTLNQFAFLVRANYHF